MTKEEYIKKYHADDAVGWLAIDGQLEKIYGDQEPRHYGPSTGIHYMLGGLDPIDGISVYDNTFTEPHLHLVSYGMSELYYSPENLDEEFSKWGFEFTFRLKPFEEDKGDPAWVMEVFNNLARYVYESGRWFEENQFIPANGPIRLDTDTEMVGFVTALDPQLGKIETDNGEVSFIKMIGVTQKELDKIMENPTNKFISDFLDHMKGSNPLLITDLNRKS